MSKRIGSSHKLAFLSRRFLRLFSVGYYSVRLAYFFQRCNLKKIPVCVIEFLISAVLLVGCTTASVRENREAPTGIGASDALTFVLSPRFSIYARPVEEGAIVGCISNVVHKANPLLRIIPPDEFRRAVFPDLAPEAAPNNPEYLRLLLDQPTFKERVTSLGVRYLISIVGGTEQSGHTGVGGIGGGPGPGILIIGGGWDRKSSLIASVLDLQQERIAGQVEASASGHPWFLIMVPGPIIGVPAFTESKVCEDLGEAVAKFIAGEDVSKSEEEQK